jgi:hypothetical protein
MYHVLGGGTGGLLVFFWAFCPDFGAVLTFPLWLIWLVPRHLLLPCTQVSQVQSHHVPVTDCIWNQALFSHLSRSPAKSVSINLFSTSRNLSLPNHSQNIFKYLGGKLDIALVGYLAMVEYIGDTDVGISISLARHSWRQVSDHVLASHRLS